MNANSGGATAASVVSISSSPDLVPLVFNPEPLGDEYAHDEETSLDSNMVSRFSYWCRSCSLLVPSRLLLVPSLFLLGPSLLLLVPSLLLLAPSFFFLVPWRSSNRNRFYLCVGEGCFDGVMIHSTSLFTSMSVCLRV